MSYQPLAKDEQQSKNKEEIVKHKNPLYPTLKYPQPKPLHTLGIHAFTKNLKSLHHFFSNNLSSSIGTILLLSVISMLVVRFIDSCILIWNSGCLSELLSESFFLFWRFSDYKMGFTVISRNQYDLDYLVSLNLCFCHVDHTYYWWSDHTHLSYGSTFSHGIFFASLWNHSSQSLVHSLVLISLFQSLNDGQVDSESESSFPLEDSKCKTAMIFIYLQLKFLSESVSLYFKSV